MAPISGTVKLVTECEDEVFALEALGKGVVIEPEEGKVYAPCDGEISAFFETKHAIGITAVKRKDSFCWNLIWILSVRKVCRYRHLW